MVVQVQLPKLEAPARILVGAGFNQEAYWNFCVANPNVRSELNAQGEIVVMPPAGGESSYRSLNVGRHLANWAERDGRGKAFDSSGGFVLPSGAVYAPDAAWVANARLQTLSKNQRQRFLPLAPDFVVEVMSPRDRLPQAKAKMVEWIAGGTELAWLIDAERRRVIVYRRDGIGETFNGLNEIRGEGPVDGFVLELKGIWEGL